VCGQTLLNHFHVMILTLINYSHLTQKKKITQGLKSQQSIILRFDYQIHQEEEELIISVYMYNIFFTSLVEEDIDFNQSLFW